MFIKFEIIFVLLFGIKTFTQSLENLICSEQFCENYVEQHGCENIGTACTIQNQTFNGELYGSPVPCNCCKTCIQNLNEGDLCSIGSPGMAPPNIACGPGLICSSDDKSSQGDYHCKKMDHTNCFRDQIKYDEMKNSNQGIGLFIQRPQCDGDGHYTSVKCNVGQMCYCVDKMGERIFGEAPYRPLIEKTMHCDCARLNANFNNYSNLKYQLPTARCLEDGSFDPIQCIDDKCVCVERQSGTAIDENYYNVSSLEFDKIPCFDNKIHSKYSYLHDCEIEQWDLLEQFKESEINGFNVINFKIRSCQADGWFPALQEREKTYVCVDKYGRKIDDFEIQKNSIASKNMNCKCARTRNVLIQNLGKNNVTDILPQCCPNGNYKNVQCRKDNCYCSDENGLQIGIEQHKLNITLLSCYNNGIFC